VGGVGWISTAHGWCSAKRPADFSTPSTRPTAATTRRCAPSSIRRWPRPGGRRPRPPIPSRSSAATSTRSRYGRRERGLAAPRRQEQEILGHQRLDGGCRHGEGREPFEAEGLDARARLLHFPIAYQQEFFHQLTSEEVRTRFVRGHPVRYWFKPSGVRNEALDRRAYALAALDASAGPLTRSRITQALERCYNRTSRSVQS